VEPAGALEDGVPVELARSRQGDGRVVAVVHHLRGPLVGAGFEVLDPHAAFPPDDMVGVHAGPPQLRHTGVGYRMGGGQGGHKGRRSAEAGQGHRYIGLSAAEGRDELRGLEDALQVGRRKPKHDFAEGYGFSQHGRMAMLARGGERGNRPRKATDRRRQDRRRRRSEVRPREGSETASFRSLRDGVP